MVSSDSILSTLTPMSTQRRSRRSVIRGIGGGALAVAVTTGPGGGMVTRAQDSGDSSATPAALPDGFFGEFLEAWGTAAATGDAALVMPFYADDSLLEDVPMNVAFTGPAEIEPFLIGFFGNYSDASVTWRSVVVTEDRAAAEVLFTGRYTGQIPGLPAGTGQQLTTRSVHVYELGDGAITRQSLYFDAYGFLIQLGVLPAPGE